MRKHCSFTRTKQLEPHLLEETTYAYKGWGPRGEGGTPCCQGLYSRCKCDNEFQTCLPRHNWKSYDLPPQYSQEQRVKI